MTSAAQAAAAEQPVKATAPAHRPRRRRKIPLACEPCRERKSRCDGGKPICSGCQRRSLRLEDCIYTVENARTASNEAYIKTLHDRIRQLEQTCVAEGFECPPVGPSDAAQQGHQQLNKAKSSSVSPLQMNINPADGIARIHQQRPEAHILISSENDSNLLPAQPSGESPLEVSRLAKSTTPPSSRSSNMAMYDPALRSGNLRAHFQPRSPYNHVMASPMHQHSSSPHLEDTSPREVGITGMGTINSEDGIIDESPESSGVTKMTAGDFFYGNSSAASFIREACSTIGKNSGSAGRPSPTGHPQHQSQKQAPMSFGQSANFVLPPRQLADHLLDVYFKRVFYLYPFFHRPAFERAYRSLWEPASSTQSDKDGADKFAGVGLGGSPAEGANSGAFHCALNGVLAIAVHHSDLPVDERPKVSEMFFLRSKAHVGLNLVEQNTLATVQALLIAALFLQSTPYPSRCWNSVGIACRLAQGLGLHAETGGNRSLLQREIRRRTWYGCVVLDMHVSMTFGRPTMTTFSNMPLPSIIDDPIDDDSIKYRSHMTPTRSQFFIESIRMSRVLEQIIVRVYQPWKSGHGGGVGGGDQHLFSLDTVIELDAQLSQFEKSVPWQLNWAAGSGVKLGGLSPEMGPLLRMQRNVLRARCLYLRLMLFRPVLTQLISDRDRTPRGVEVNTQAQSVGRNMLSSSFAAECGRSCAQAAIDLIDVTLRTYTSEETGAWWWNGLYASTSGLVLILARSCPSVWVSLEHTQVQQAWERCQEILTNLSGVSVSIQKSLRLLQTLSDAASSHATGGVQTHPVALSGPQDSSAASQEAAAAVSQDAYGGSDFLGLLDLDMMEAALVSWDQETSFGFDFSNLG